MDDGELDFSNQEIFSNPEAYQQNLGGDVPGSRSMDSFFDDIFTDTHACTHTHTCNPPGPDLSHSHTCLHVHTKIVPASSEDKGDDSAESSERKGSKKRPLGNREAVRKYREKKKARAASLEDEVVRLRALNQQLLKRLQGQAALESEAARLKCLLVDIRGRIEGEIGSFPYQKSSATPAVVGNNGSYGMNPCNIQCGGQIYCHPEGRNSGGSAANIEPYSGCGFENLPCAANPNGSGLMDCGAGTLPLHAISSGRNKKKGVGGASHAATANGRAS